MTAQLNTLLRLRQYELDRSQVRLAQAQQQEAELADRLAALDREYADHRAQLTTLCRHGQLNIDALRYRQDYLRILTTRRRDLEADCTAARTATHECRNKLQAAHQQLQIIERLRERALAAWQADQVRKETLAIDEVWQVLRQA